MRVRDPTRKSLLEFHGPVFPIDVTGQEVIQCPVFLSIQLNKLIYHSRRFLPRKDSKSTVSNKNDISCR